MVVCSLWLASCLVGFLDTVFRLGVNEDEMHVKSRECAGIEDIKSELLQYVSSRCAAQVRRD